jgi:L-ribulose-5-phosphate 3-epimerase
MTTAAADFGINSYSYIYDTDALGFLQRLHQLGFSRFELMAFPGHLWPGEATSAQKQAIRKYVEDNGLVVTTLNQPNIDINIAGASPEMRRYSLDVIAGIIELAGEIGCANVIVGPGKANGLLSAPLELLAGRFFDGLDFLLPVAKRAGVNVLVENMPFAFLPDAQGLLAALERYGDPGIGVVYDIANGAFIGADVAAELELLSPRLKYLHVSDTTRTRYDHAAIGLTNSVIDFAALAAPVGRLDLLGPPIIEVISASPDGDIRESAAKLSALGW